MALHPEVPGRYDVALAGRPYMVDLGGETPDFRRQSIPLLRNQADTSAAFGEGSLNPEELVRRGGLSWHHGAGQTYYDREDSDPQRFRASKGMDVWSRWELTLLHDTVVRRSSASTRLIAQPVGNFLYLVDGAELLLSGDVQSWGSVGGLPSAPLSIATDGFTVWTAHGMGGVYSTSRGTYTSSQLTGVWADIVGYVKGRLMSASGSSLYNITAASLPTPAALYTHPNPDFRWVGFAEGPASIYMAGFSGDKSLIYRTNIKQDGTALDAPIIAGELPDGEVVTAIDSYLGFVLLGTTRGVRFCGTNPDGSLVIGSLVPTPFSVYCFEGQDQFVWFGWSAYDATSTGLGRMDLTTFIAPLTPAYASDLMTPGQGPVSSVVTFAGRRVFTVEGLGVVEQSVNRVPTGTLDTGMISYGIVDPKVAVYLDVQIRANQGITGASISADSSPMADLGVKADAATATPFSIPSVTGGEAFDVRLRLDRGALDPTASPALTRWTLRSYPNPSRGEIFTVPLLLHEVVRTRGDDEVTVDPVGELAFLLALQRNRGLVAYQIGTEEFQVIVDDSVFSYSHRTADGGWNGTLTLKLKAIV